MKQDLEVGLLLEAIYRTYHYDFRQYAPASLKRRLLQAMTVFHCNSITGLQELILHDVHAFPRLLQYLTVQVSDMFRDPEFYLAVRRQVVPILATYPSIKVWVAGCSTGEEAYSFAVLLAEEGLLDRTLIYATDINDESLNTARLAVYALERVKQFTLSHRAAGGKGSLSEHYHATQDGAVMSPHLRQRITFADHSLATDSTFSEVQLVSCRNVLIYFNRELQDRAVSLFKDALCPRGFLCLGTRETLRFTTSGNEFATFASSEKVFRKVA
jgi:chemotaxis protein methyltransferase CheR